MGSGVLEGVGKLRLRAAKGARGEGHVVGDEAVGGVLGRRHHACCITTSWGF